MTTPIRLTAVMSHPVQYWTPLFRYITDHCPGLTLTVLYITTPSARQQGSGFGIAFQWDLPLREGYVSRVLREPRPNDDFQRFRGLPARGLSRLVASTRPDVVLLQGWQFLPLVKVALACRALRVPVLYRGDSNLLRGPSGWRRLAWLAKARSMLALFDGYLSVGHHAREYLLGMGCNPTRIFDSPHCVDHDFFRDSALPFQTDQTRSAVREAFGIEPGAFVVLFVGKLEEEKRPLDLIRAMQRSRPGEVLLVVGTGELEPDCRAEAKRLNVQVVWGGFLNQSELGRAYAAADVLVLPSGSETWGLVVNEALATGLPCVVTDLVGCAPDLITPGQTGEVYPAGDVRELTRALSSVRSGLDSSTPYRQLCRDRAAAYSLAPAAAGIATACRAVTAQAAGPWTPTGGRGTQET